MTSETMLKNLLAILHRDGGHYTVEHGVEKSYDDGKKILYCLKFQLEEILSHTDEVKTVIEGGASAEKFVEIFFTEEFGRVGQSC